MRMAGMSMASGCKMLMMDVAVVSDARCPMVVPWAEAAISLAVMASAVGAADVGSGTAA